MPALTHHLALDRVGPVRRTAHGLEAELGAERLRVDVVRPDVVRVAVSRGGRFEDVPTHAVCVDPLALDVPFELEEADGVVRLRTAQVVVSVHLEPFRLDVHRGDGSRVAETFQDGDGRWWPYATLNDAFVVRRRCGLQDAIYGLGEKTGRQNRRGRDFTLWNTDVLDPDASGEFAALAGEDDPRADNRSTEFDPYYVSIPFFYHQDHASGAMSASFLDNGYRSHYDFTPDDEYVIRADGGQYVEYLFAGPTMAGILEAYTWLTGRTGLPPLWALGYHQSRWARYTQADVEALGARHRSERIPCDALWLDIDYMDGYRVFTWDPERYPDPAGMLARLADQGLRVITIIDPGIKREPGYRVYDQAVERDVLCRTEGGDTYVGQVWPGITAFPDFATPEAREWWGELNAAHVATGLAGIWNDMNEPATGVIDARGMRFGRGALSHERLHNQYGLLMAMATTQGLLAARPDLRPFVLTRAGFAGIQRYAASWMGDNMSRWDHLWMSIPMATGFGVSGQSFVGADVGGFMGHSNAELFLRWLQLGVLTPFCRNHSSMGNVDQYAWAFGATVRDLARAAIELRYRLMPYLYAAFVQASETGMPVQRPLVLDHQDDPLVRDVDDEYLLGPDLLVAPVVAAGMTARQVYLPAGRWYDWYTGETHAGGSFVLVPTPMDRIPLFARGGAVVPMWPVAPPSTAGYRPSVVDLHLFVPDDGTSRTALLQEDDGLTSAALDGARVRTTFTVERSGALVRLRADVEGDGFPEWARDAYRLVVQGAAPRVVHLDGDAVEPTDGAFVLPVGARAFTVELCV
ncbi:glycoside hydrolase family 31 protein [Actinotalea subterranea]|uniref:glycoside hydrolase family 31 protein n=1 Tax=Actinotalea subterranea TaxID=2607497 RepID=UPI0011EC901A|nr:TIM-barrel domain-containing protein [Actinotalea subterranea]